MKKLFICIINYTQPLEIIEKHLKSHRDYLKEWYAKDILLASGPKCPKDGGIIIGKFNNICEAILFSKNDPYTIHNLATYNIIEFDPILHSSILNEFLNDK